MTLLSVSELFVSIQGETTHAGRPSAFVRLAGCDLECSWCDTTYARSGGEEWDLDELLAWVEGASRRLVSITGGEPLHQRSTPEFVDRLLDCGFEVLIETNGVHDIAALDSRAYRILDLKTPSSGMAGRMMEANLEQLGVGDELKLVLADRRDFDHAIALLDRFSGDRAYTVLMAPVWGVLDPATLWNWIIEDELDVRLQLQLHKFVWGAARRGI